MYRGRQVAGGFISFEYSTILDVMHALHIRENTNMGREPRHHTVFLWSFAIISYIRSQRVVNGQFISNNVKESKSPK